MKYVPTEKSIVAANLDKIRKVRTDALKNSGSSGEMQMMSKIVSFEKEVQQMIDNSNSSIGKWLIDIFVGRFRIEQN